MTRSYTRLIMLTALIVAGPVLAGPALAGPVLTSSPKPMHGAKYLPMAKVTLATARATALKARPGAITDQELEREKGGTGLRYSFDISNGGKAYEVGVDAKTGAILENIAEGAHPD